MPSTRATQSLPIRFWLFACLLAILASASTRAFAVPPLAGTNITNRANVTFEVAGQPVRLDSNIVSVTVSPVEDLTLTANNDVSDPPGASIYLPHRLTNTGNTPTSYTLAISNLGGDDYDLSNLVLYRDSNGNGTLDAGEPLINPADTILLNPGESVDLLIGGTIPPSTAPGLASRVQIVAANVANSVTELNTDTVRAEAGTVVDLKKSATPQSAKRGEEVTFNITATTPGAGAPSPIPVTVDGAAQNLIIVRDIVPANTTFVALDDAGFGTRLYHRSGDAPQTYVTSTPADLTQVDAVAVGAAAFPANGTLILRFRVRVTDIAAGNITNLARIFFIDLNGNQTRETTSNVVLVSIPTASPVLQYYTGEDYARIAAATGIGRPLYLQANAASCNQSPTEIERVVVTVTSRLTNDSVRYTAIETGPNTGIFRVAPPIPTSGDAPNAGDDILQVLKDDTLVARLSDCGGGEDAVTSILVDPFGVVFDSRTNLPIAGASVTLIDVTGAGNGGNAGGPAQVLQFDGVTPAPSTVITGADGTFQFPQVAPSTYRLVVTPPAGFAFPSQIAPALLPPGRIIDPSGSYGGSFTVVGVAAIQLDVPLDPPAPSGLFVEKTASRRVVEIADWVDYRVRVRNNSGVAIFAATLTDTLPRGFALQKGSVKINGVSTPDPIGAPGPDLIFALGPLAPDAEITITYRVRVGANARMGDNSNRAQAVGSIVGGTIASNVGAAKVKVEPGVFTTRGIIIGKVFVDVNKNKIQDEGELGIPGVRLYLENGTFAITDGEGKYSIYGVSATTHNVKLDKTTMPAGSVLEPLTVKHAGSGGSCFADMTNGELQKINFAESSATEAILKIVKERRERAAKADLALAETDALRSEMNPDGPSATSSDTRSLPASGTKTSGGAISPSGNTSSANGGIVPPLGYGTVPPLTSTRQTFGGQIPRTALDGPLDGYTSPPVAVAPGVSLKSLDEILPNLNSDLDFVDFKDQDTLPGDQIGVRVKGVLGSSFKLLVNGEPVSQKRLGSKATFADGKIEAWEWIGVRLKTGPNTLEVQQLDNFGNARGAKKITLIAPGDLAQLQVTSEKSAYAADGQTPLTIKVRLADAKGVLVSSRTPITLESSAGFWQVEDLNKAEPGAQVFLEGGQGTFKLLPPQEPAEAEVRVSSGAIESTLRLSFLPELRPLIASGVLDAKLGFGFNAKSARRSGVGDSFDDDLRKFADNGNTNLGVRGAMFLKGRIQGKYLLTMRYDSSRDGDERLFRDIQPDEYYPVYGDASTKGFDAQSTGRLYVRVDRNHSYVLYGDYTTLDDENSQNLARYNRSLTGFKAHKENSRFSGTAFFSRDNSRRIVEEIRGAGISGPYLLNNPDILENSEKVEIVVRDRNQPSVVLRVTPQARFSDYTIDGLTEGLLFRAPVPSFDADLNPVFIRVSYEADQGGPKFNTYGFNGQFKVSNNFQIGGSYVKDDNPQDGTSLRSLNAAYRLGKSTVILGEWAQSDRIASGTTGLPGTIGAAGKGDATRLEIIHSGKKLQARFLMGRSSENFNNPESLLSGGHSETSLRATYRLSKSTRLAGEIVKTEDRINGVQLTGAQASLERAFGNKLRGQFGVRHASGQADAVSNSSGGADVNFTSLFARLTAQVTPKANVFARYEKSLTNQTQSFALGGDYQIAPRTRAYLIHEFLDSPDGLYALNENNRSYGTRFGVETDYMKNGHAFGEYRMNNGLDGRSAEAAYGLRNLWPIGKGVRLSTSFERTRALGQSDGLGILSNENSTAAGVGIEWLRGDNFKATARLEARKGDNFDSVLQTMGIAYKPSRDLTLLARNAYAKTKGQGGGDRTQQRFQLGAAFRQTDTDKWNALAKYEYRLGDDSGTFGSGFASDSQRQVHIFSFDTNYQPASRLSMRLHYAFKRAVEKGSGDAISAQLLSARLVKEISPRTDLSFIMSTLRGDNPGTQKFGLGVELSYAMTRNLLLSGGYNFFDLQDDDLLADGAGRRGAYVRMRFKFDESSFDGLNAFRKPAALPSHVEAFEPVSASMAGSSFSMGPMSGMGDGNSSASLGQTP